MADGSGAVARPRGPGDQGRFCSGLRVVVVVEAGGGSATGGSLSPDWATWSTHEDYLPGGDLPALCPLRNSRLLTSLGSSLKIMPVQKQTRSGHWTRFKIFVTFGDCYGRGLGVKCSKHVGAAI